MRKELISNNLIRNRAIRTLVLDVVNIVDWSIS